MAQLPTKIYTAESPLFHAFSGVAITAGTYYSPIVRRPTWSRGMALQLELANETTPSWTMQVQLPFGGDASDTSKTKPWSANFTAMTAAGIENHMMYPTAIVAGDINTSIIDAKEAPLPQVLVIRFIVTGTADAEAWIQWLA